jgi:membrane associated rhomboid family serine protease
MIPIGDRHEAERIPFVTWMLIALNVIIYVWDRHGGFFGPNQVFADLAMRPREVVASMLEVGDPFALTTVFTSMFLHGNLMHIAGNMLFLGVFGPAVEDAMGGARYALFYLAWGVMAAIAQIWVDPGSIIPTLGASGAIGGVLGAYFLLYPGNKIEIVVPLLLFLSFEVAAWILLGGWFLFQIFMPQEGVAVWAHIGGFLSGMVTVLVIGGRRNVLRARFGYVPTEF